MTVVEFKPRLEPLPDCIAKRILVERQARILVYIARHPDGVRWTDLLRDCLKADYRNVTLAGQLNYHLIKLAERGFIYKDGRLYKPTPLGMVLASSIDEITRVGEVLMSIRWLKAVLRKIDKLYPE